MTHVSNNKLNEKLLNQLFAEMAKIMSPKQSTEAKSILADLLTETEQIMLTKRLAAILMINGGNGIHVVASRLKLSTSTTFLMYEKYSQGSYDNLIKIINRRKQSREEMVDLINKIARLGMPEMGKGRWKSLK